MTGAPAGRPVRFTDAYWFPVPPASLWDTLEQFELYPTWWAWLREFTARPDGGGLSEGTSLRGVVVPPVPWRLSLQVTLDRCRRPALIEARVDGDARGDAVLALAAAGGGTQVSVAWTLYMVSPPLRLATRVAFPLVRWGHDQVVGMAVSGFRRHALPTAGR